MDTGCDDIKWSKKKIIDCNANIKDGKEKKGKEVEKIVSVKGNKD